MKKICPGSVLKSVILFCIFIFNCFHAPSPSYLRPGHPEWPVGWITGIPLDSLEQQIPQLKQLGITCIGISVNETQNSEKEILDLCERNHIKLLLQMEDPVDHLPTPISLADTESANGLKIRKAVLLQMTEVISRWNRNRKTGFPIHIIPAIQYGLEPLHAGIPDESRVEQAIQRVRMAQHFADSLVSGMLVFRPMEFRLFNQSSRFQKDQTIKIWEKTRIIQPVISDSFLNSLKYQMVGPIFVQRNVAEYQQTLCIPKIDHSGMPQSMTYASMMDSLISICAMIHADAVMWDAGLLLSNKVTEKARALHKSIRLQSLEK